MSNLDDQLKELTNRKLKSEFLAELKNVVQTFKILDKYKEISEECNKEVLGFIDSHVDMIESGEIKQPEISSLFTSQEVEALKLLASRALTTKSNNKNDKPQNIIKDDQPVDKVGFALQHRHLGGKEVTVITSHGNVDGKVVGIDHPNIVVKTVTGATIYETPDKIINVK